MHHGQIILVYLWHTNNLVPYLCCKTKQVIEKGVSSGMADNTLPHVRCADN